MNDDIELISINEFARRFLSPEKITLPKAIHDALQNIFTKHRKGENNDNVKYRSLVIKSSEQQSQPKNEVIKGKSAAIYNALCLLYLIGTGETKKLFQHYYNTRSTPEKRDFSVLVRESERQYLEFFCLGIVRENIDKITNCLLSNEFDLFTKKLPSPFYSNSGDENDLTPMLKLYQQDIPWKEYMECYEKAEMYFSEKKLEEAKKAIDDLNRISVIRLPIVEYLDVKIKSEEAELKEAWNYLQELLN